VSHVSVAVRSVGRTVAGFHPRTVPPLSRSAYRRELAAWTMLPLALGAVEGGVTGVLAKNVFDGALPDRWLNLAVGVLASAPAFANVTSFAWSALAHGRHKVRIATVLQIASIAMVAVIALAPRNAAGLLLLTAAAVGARVCWSGVTILRSTIWAANFPRSARATMAGRFATVQSFAMAGAGALVGVCSDLDPEAFRIVYPCLAAISLVGAWIYAAMRVRGHRALLRAERDEDRSAFGRVNPWRLRRILLEDERYRRYMTCMMVFGSGNLMVAAPLIIALKDHFAFAPQREVLIQMLIATTIPLALIPFAVPLWSRLLDRVHVIRFRAFHCWAFVTFIAMILIAAVTHQTWLLFAAAVMKGIAFGGGILGWNLGHHDFAPVERSAEYMTVHVMLTGIRGLLAPLIGTNVYVILEWWRPGTGVWTFALCLALSLTGAVGFVLLERRERLLRAA